MRTTLTLDAEVAAALARLRKRRDISLKGLVNEALRLGLKEMAAGYRRRRSIRTGSVSLGACDIGVLLMWT